MLKIHISINTITSVKIKLGSKHVQIENFFLIVVLLITSFFLSSCIDNSDDSPTNDVLTDTLIYYDETQNTSWGNPWGDGTESHLPMLAVKFTPTSYPATLTKVEFFVVNATGSSKLFDLHGFSDGIDGDPDETSEIFTSITEQTVPATSSGEWVTVTLQNTIINSGSFWIAMEWKTKPLEAQSGQNSYYVGYDGSKEYQSRLRFLFTNDYSWGDGPEGDMKVKLTYNY